MNRFCPGSKNREIIENMLIHLCFLCFSISFQTKMACSKQFLNFEPTEKPAWRNRLPENADGPNISDMIMEIVECRRQFTEMKRNKNLNKESTKDIDFDFLLQFLLNIQLDEGIGLKNEGATKEVVQRLEDDWPVVKYERLLEKLDTHEFGWTRQSSSSSSGQESNTSTDAEGGKRKRQFSWESYSSQDSNNSSDDERGKRPKTGRTKDDFDPPNYPSTGNTEEILAYAHEIMSQDEVLCKDLDETINLYKGYKCLAAEIDKISKKERKLVLGLIDVDVFILEVHKILMDKVMDDKNTRPGQFSTRERSARFKGELHTYPRFATEELAHITIQTLVDKYADMREEIRKIPDRPENEKEKIEKSFKCASLFLFGFLTLHPFGDGNGRLARLLCSYSLFTFSPFLTPIFNVFSPSVNSDYVDALVASRQGLKLPEIICTEQEAMEAALTVLRQKPCDLCSLLIQSNHYMWKEYLRRIFSQKI